MYRNYSKATLDKMIQFTFRSILGILVAAFALLVEVGMFAVRTSSFFAAEYLDSEASTFVGFILSSPIYLVFPVAAGVLAALFPKKVGQLLVRSGEDTYSYW